MKTIYAIILGALLCGAISPVILGLIGPVNVNTEVKSSVKNGVSAIPEDIP
jgi:hypothetical protein